MRRLYAYAAMNAHRVLKLETAKLVGNLFQLYRILDTQLSGGGGREAGE